MFHLPFFGGISESVVMMYAITIVMIVVGMILTRNLKVVNPGKRQLAVESFFLG